MPTFLQYLKAYWQLFRLEHGLIYGFATTVGIIVAGQPIDFRAFLAYTTALFFQASTFALNDYFDYYVDLENRRFDRPLVRGEIKREQAFKSFLVTFPLGFITSYMISLQAFIFASAIALLGVAYDVKLKELGFLGNVYIALSMAAPFVFGGIVVNSVTPTVLVLASIAFFCGLGREIMKSIEDVAGDRIRNVRSIARIYGVDFAAKVSTIFFIISIVLSFTPLIFEEYRDPKYFFPVLLTDAILFKVSINLLKKKYYIKKFRIETLLAVIVGLIAFIAGAF
ncbi:MAG: UbiA family prenyltransferase [Archaeoglobaceae archaeon]|nr:UbiA family prenyltransferase [Archaeoglobaceae archaeon]MCX8152108.1 UbiA family prenyltransferase [Archaeoglobaceae archaeon]MDW8013543.1 UbiA family prenyltransferase [Archaeoglobaceae archaeon]